MNIKTKIDAIEIIDTNHDRDAGVWNDNYPVVNHTISFVDFSNLVDKVNELEVDIKEIQQYIHVFGDKTKDMLIHCQDLLDSILNVNSEQKIM